MYAMSTSACGNCPSASAIATLCDMTAELPFTVRERQQILCLLFQLTEYAGEIAICIVLKNMVVDIIVIAFRDDSAESA
jgi:hypothetical protein